MTFLEKIKWFFKIGWKLENTYNGDEMGDVIAVYRNKKTGEKREELL